MTNCWQILIGCMAASFIMVPTLAQDALEGAAGPVNLGRVPHATGAYKVDGILDEALWDDALHVELHLETNPRENLPAPVKTIAYVTENGSHLLVAFEALDPNPEAIRAHLSDRDTAWRDDLVGFVIDTFGDARRAFQFFVNPLGVQMDSTMDDINGREDDSWNAIWDSEGTISDKGYVVEMAIPFSQLRFQQPQSDQTWGIDLVRMYPREDNARLSMSPKDRGRNCDLCQLPQITGFADVELGRDIEVVPALTASQTDTRDPNLGSLMPGASQSDVGVTVSWGITPDITANLALNPDFSQVEADAAQLDVNNQFALQFPETRPFFLEGADFFSTPINAVFTRTISDPDIGAKLTGRRGASTFGAFAAEDTLTNLLFPGALGSASHTLNETNDSFVGRYQFGFGESSAIGALVTNRSAAGYSNRVAGFDGRYRITGEHSLRFQYLNSETEYPDSIATDFDQPLGRFSGNALNVNYNYGTRNWSGFVNYRRFDPDFRADSGFVSQVDFENRSIGGARIWHGEGNNWWNMFRVGGNTGSTHDISGQLLSRFWETFLALQGPYQSFVQSGTGKSRQFWNGQLFDRDFFFVFGQIRPNGSLNFQMSIQKGDQIDFANSRLGKQLSINPQITWNVNRHLLVRLRHTSRQLDTQEGEKIFDATLDDLRLTWQFNVRNFLRLTVQRQDIERNLDAFTSPFFDAQSVSMGRQLLYSYKLNPQTVVFAGYSDNLIENDTLTTLTKTDRTFFLKFSYAWIP